MLITTRISYTVICSISGFIQLRFESLSTGARVEVSDRSVLSRKLNFYLLMRSKRTCLATLHDRTLDALSKGSFVAF